MYMFSMFIEFGGFENVDINWLHMKKIQINVYCSSKFKPENVLKRYCA